MTHPLLTRAHLEAVLVGLAAMRPELAPDLYAMVRPERVSTAARTLLAAVIDQPADAWQCLPQLAETIGQHAMALRALELTLGDLTFHTPALLVALVNQLPMTTRAPREAAWERHLADGLRSAAA
jgi:hypothetical protein